MFVQISIQRTKKGKLMVQIKDISDKILNKKIQAEKILLILINATVSHELRNPLASMIGQIYALGSFFKLFAGVLSTLNQDPSPNIKKLRKDLFKIFKGLQGCGKKIINAAKFIDYFVNDILDYTLLNKEGRNFIKNMCVFNIHEAVVQIIQIQEDKAEFKNIKITTLFIGFELDSYFVKTDLKRLQ
jgi:signal transduction histidine kinase